MAKQPSTTAYNIAQVAMNMAGYYRNLAAEEQRNKMVQSQAISGAIDGVIKTQMRRERADLERQRMDIMRVESERRGALQEELKPLREAQIDIAKTRAEREAIKRQIDKRELEVLPEKIEAEKRERESRESINWLREMDAVADLQSALAKQGQQAGLYRANMFKSGFTLDKNANLEMEADGVTPKMDWERVAKIHMTRAEANPRRQAQREKWQAQTRLMKLGYGASVGERMPDPSGAGLLTVTPQDIMDARSTLVTKYKLDDTSVRRLQAYRRRFEDATRMQKSIMVDIPAANDAAIWHGTPPGTESTAPYWTSLLENEIRYARQAAANRGLPITKENALGKAFASAEGELSELQAKENPLIEAATGVGGVATGELEGPSRMTIMSLSARSRARALPGKGVLDVKNGSLQAQLALRTAMKQADGTLVTYISTPGQGIEEIVPRDWRSEQLEREGRIPKPVEEPAPTQEIAEQRIAVEQISDRGVGAVAAALGVTGVGLARTGEPLSEREKRAQRILSAPPPQELNREWFFGVTQTNPQTPDANLEALYNLIFEEGHGLKEPMMEKYLEGLSEDQLWNLSIALEQSGTTRRGRMAP